MMTYTIFYTRHGATRSYTFVGTAAEKDAEVAAMLNTEGVTDAWYTLN